MEAAASTMRTNWCLLQLRQKNPDNSKKGRAITNMFLPLTEHERVTSICKAVIKQMVILIHYKNHNITEIWRKFNTLLITEGRSIKLDPIEECVLWFW